MQELLAKKNHFFKGNIYLLSKLPYLCIDNHYGMKLSEIKKGLGGKGTLIEIETGYNEWVAYRNKDIHYDNLCLYCFEKFIHLQETTSPVIRFICEKYGVDKVFAYQDWGHSEEIGHCLLGEDKNGMKHYDYDCYYLIAVPKSVSDSIPENEGELIKE